MTFTKEQLLNQARENVKALKMAAVQNAFEEIRPAIERDLALAEMALAGMEAEPVGEVSEQRDGLILDGTVDLGGTTTHRIIKGASKMKRLPLGTKFYTAPQPLTTSERAELENYRNAQPVAWRWNYGGTTSWRLQETKPNYGNNHKFPRVIQPLYATPQPATVVDADDNFYSWFGREWADHYQPNQYTTAAKQMLGVMAESAWKAGRRAAMLKGGNHTERHLDMVDHSGEANEKVHDQTQFKPVADLYGITSPTGSETSFTFDAVEARDFIDGGWTCQEYVELDRFQDAMTNHSGDANEKGNSPVIPGCWCRTCRPVKMNDMRFVVCPDCGNKRCPHANDCRNVCTGSNEPGQDGSAYPAAPKEEAVSSALEHGMARYYGAMQKLADGGD